MVLYVRKADESHTRRVWREFGLFPSDDPEDNGWTLGDPKKVRVIYYG